METTAPEAGVSFADGDGAWQWAHTKPKGGARFLSKVKK